MTGVEKLPLLPRRTYEDDQRRQGVVRLRWAAVLALGPIGLAVPINLFVFAGTAGQRLLLLGVVAAICAAGLLATLVRGAERWVRELTVVFVLAVAFATGRLILQSPTDLDVFVGVVAASMMTTALLFPWGGWTQLLVSMAVAGGYLWLPPWSTYDGGRIANVILALSDGVFLSVMGAFTLDRQRRATFEEREQAAALAAQREQLLEASRELADTLDLPDLCTRIVRRGRALVASDAVALALVDEARHVLRTVALEGEFPERMRALLDVEVTVQAASPFFAELRRCVTAEVPCGGPLDVVVPAMRERFGAQRVLFAPVQRDGRLLGYLAFMQVRPAPSFAVHERNLAAGLARMSAVALANARLFEEVERANRLKSEFVSTMSHELRTPLGVIMGYTEILEDGDASMHAEAIDRIRRSSAELLEMIQETLNLNRLESGHDLPQLEPVALASFWDELGTELGALPRAETVRLRFRAVPDATLVTDRRKLRIIVKNLVGNALKFTAQGEVEASCALAAAGCAITVRDTGIGITVEDLPVIFEMFRQADSSDRRSYGGVGLGLHIVRRLVEQLGGQIDVQSEPGRGSTFHVTLPHRVPAQVPTAAAA